MKQDVGSWEAQVQPCSHSNNITQVADTVPFRGLVSLMLLLFESMHHCL